MNFVLIISIILMSYISYRYNTFDWFEIFLVDILVQLFHIGTLCFILYVSITQGSFLVWLFCIIGFRTLFKCFVQLFVDIKNEFFFDDEDDDESNDINKDQQQNETKVDDENKEQ